MRSTELPDRMPGNNSWTTTLRCGHIIRKSSRMPVTESSGTGLQPRSIPIERTTFIDAIPLFNSKYASTIKVLEGSVCGT
ncbi:hypothetical protein IscW_ISCW008301 [Ixodes scapularis]|uniref:Uncharacterized protein n=1 Tax=Ixodes scapularis TaxID=6945 RepID=B7PRI9_IXOSC|nr:hypothetical protein IscW_ISCW008301 [Ixodes scapularis]|eukprot:XP_002399869.1 hypothetical protein IscW_ISCW008301 [Ixodes scapularis]